MHPLEHTYTRAICDPFAGKTAARVVNNPLLLVGLFGPDAGATRRPSHNAEPAKQYTLLRSRRLAAGAFAGVAECASPRAP